MLPLRGGPPVPSAGEGFGLPVIEAASHSTPVIISDLPVLREIAADHATYCRTESPAALAGSLEAWLDAVASGSIPRSSEMRTLTWDDSAEQLLQIVLDGNWYRRLP
jgi:glycosyltransferase involved in cell wall biosynthesis